MEAQKLYTSDDLAKLNTADLVVLIADASVQDFGVQLSVKQILKQRMGNMKVALEAIKHELKSQRASSSRIYKMMLAEEIERRETFRNTENAIEKEESRIAKISGRKKPYKMAIETLLRDDKQESIFKIKKQWLNTGYIETVYSRDFPAERVWFEGEPFKMLQGKIASHSRPYELFEKGSEIRKAGFNGYTFNMSCFNRDHAKLCWFAIYLNNVLEQQPNGEFWGMEVFSWGKRRGN